jgi:exodeoxyribonuclease-3
MALHQKYPALMSLKPDIAVISECANWEILAAKAPEFQPTDVIWIGKNPNKGLGVFAFNDFRLRLASGYDPNLSLIAPVHVTGSHDLNLLAVWAEITAKSYEEMGRVGPLRAALQRYADFLSGIDCVVAGDLNNNVFWDRPNKPRNHQRAVDDLAQHGLVSAYHTDRNVMQGAEAEPTIYWRDRLKDGPTYHLDYIFIPEWWAENLVEMSVGTFEDWCGNKLSDHVPLAVEIAF